jgi:hypothetical protein
VVLSQYGLVISVVASKNRRPEPSRAIDFAVRLSIGRGPRRLRLERRDRTSRRPRKQRTLIVRALRVVARDASSGKPRVLLVPQSPARRTSCRSVHRAGAARASWLGDERRRRQAARVGAEQQGARPLADSLVVLVGMDVAEIREMRRRRNRLQFFVSNRDDFRNALDPVPGWERTSLDAQSH